MAQINKGTIASIIGNVARIVPADADHTVSVTLPPYLCGEDGSLKKGDEVVYVEFDDFTGLLLNQGTGTGGGTVDLDTTLTQEGKAAEAKAVGDRFQTIEDEVAELSEMRPVYLTQEEYDALEASGEMKPNTHYVIILGE